MRAGAFFSLLWAGAALAEESVWPQWRGPRGLGVSEEAFTFEWSPTENVAWKAPLTGRGHSSPVYWGGKIFLTPAVEVWQYDNGTAYVPSAILYQASFTW